MSYGQRSPTRTLIQVAILAAAAGALGAGVFIYWQRSVQPNAVFGEISARFAQATCAAPVRATRVHLVITGTEVTVMFPQKDAPQKQAACLQSALAQGKFRLPKLGDALLIEAYVDFEPSGRPTLDPRDQKLLHLDARWQVDSLSEDVFDKKYVEPDLQDNISELSKCWLDYGVRYGQNVPTYLYAVSYDEIVVQIKVEPDASITNIRVGRLGTKDRATDWTGGAEFRQCVRQLVWDLPWPEHGHVAPVWINTSFRMTLNKVKT